MPKNSWKIAVIPGDGIGKETTPEGVRVLEAAQKRFDLGFDFVEHDFASADYYTRHEQMLPDDWKDQLGGSDALFLARSDGRKLCLTTSHFGARSSSFEGNSINM